MTNSPFSRLDRLRGPKPMDCAEVRGYSSSFVDGDLRGRVASRFRQHVGRCKDCNSFVATLRATVLTLRDLPRAVPPPDLRERIKQRIASEGDAPTANPPAR